jgi:tetratricopeptide (TPR) repeat protein
MTKMHFAPCLALAALSACASSPAEPDARSGLRARELVASRPMVAPIGAAHRTSAGVEAEPGSRSELTSDELAIWNDPDFRRRFAESYLAETEIEPRVTVDERDRMQEVLGLISSDQMDKAARLLQKHGGEPASAVFDFTLANIHFQRDDFDRAEASYRVAVDKYPKFRRAWRNLGLIHVRQGDFEQAVSALTRVLELGGTDALTYGLLGYGYTNLRNSLAAESAYRAAILLDPATMDWKMGLARSLFEQKRYADAAALCGSFISDQPERADLWLLQANAYIGLGQPLRAAENFELVDRLGGSTADSLNTLGDIYVNEELFDLAIDSYSSAMEKSADASPVRAIRAAKVLVAHAAFRETRELVQRIDAVYGDRLETDQQKDLLKLRARLAVADGSGEEEARVLEQIVALDPLDGEALILLGQHAARGGDPERAILCYQQAAAIEAFEADAKIRHAQLLVQEHRYTEALPLLRRAQVLKPRDNVQEYLEQVERIAQTR